MADTLLGALLAGVGNLTLGETVRMQIGRPRVSKGTPASTLGMACDKYCAQLSSIVDLSENVIPEVESQSSGHIQAFKKSLIESMHSESIDDFHAGLKELSEAMENLQDQPKEGDRVFSIPLDASSAIAMFVRYALRQVQSDSRGNLLRNSLFVSMISEFEVLFGKVARLVYRKNKSALNDSDHSFTLQEMSSFSSLDDAREYLIERRISALMRDNIDGWDKWLKRASGGLTMTSLPVDWPTVREAFARRNLIVHADSTVNHLYLESVRNLTPPESGWPSKGDTLVVDARYLRGAAEAFIPLGRILTREIVCRLYKEHEEDSYGTILMEIDDCSRQGLWHASLALCEYALKLDLTMVRRIEMMTARWVALKSIYGLESIRDEVSGWDTAGLTLELAHRKDVLLDNLDDAQKSIMYLLSEKSLSVFDLATDPLYAGIANKFLKPK